MIDPVSNSYRAQIELLEEALAIERARRKAAERILRLIADSPIDRTTRDLREMASDHLVVR